MVREIHMPLDNTHADVWDALPWYVNGTLNEYDRTIVMAHLLTCEHCQAELESCQTMVAAVHRARDDCWQSSPDQLQSLFQQIDAQESRNTPWLQYFSRWARVRINRLTRNFNDLLNLPYWNWAVPAVFVVALTSTLIFGVHERPSRQFETLTNNSQTKSIGANKLQIIFSPETTASEIVKILNSLNATISDGPTEIGLFTVALNLKDGSTLTQVAIQLRESTSVTFAHPVR